MLYFSYQHHAPRAERSSCRKVAFLMLCGVLRTRELPRDCSLEDYRQWWPCLSERERDRYTAYEHRNILTLKGRALLLSYIGSSTNVIGVFAQYLALGTFPIISVSPGDTSVLLEVVRVAPTSIVTSNNTVTISTYFGPNQYNYHFTNAGLIGEGASSTVGGAGTLHTHTLYYYNKQMGVPVSNDYSLSFA